MPPLVAGLLMGVGGLLALRFLRREWTRVNAQIDAQRSAPHERAQARRLVKDPKTGTYRPASD